MVANLKFKIEYLRSICHEKFSSKSILFGFTHAFEMLKYKGWEGDFIPSGKWKALSNVENNTLGDFIYISEQKLRECFGNNGVLLCQLKIRICRDVHTAEKIFNDNRLTFCIEQNPEINQTFFVLHPEKNTMTCEGLS